MSMNVVTYHNVMTMSNAPCLAFKDRLWYQTATCCTPYFVLSEWDLLRAISTWLGFYIFKILLGAALALVAKCFSRTVLSPQKFTTAPRSRPSFDKSIEVTFLFFGYCDTMNSTTQADIIVLVLVALSGWETPQVYKYQIPGHWMTLQDITNERDGNHWPHYKTLFSAWCHGESTVKVAPAFVKGKGTKCPQLTRPT